MLRSYPHFDTNIEPVDLRTEKIVDYEIIEAIDRVIQLGDVIPNVAENAGGAEATTRIDELADSGTKVVKDVRKTEIAVNDRRIGVLGQAFNFSLQAAPK